ncbi:ribosome silencing factor [Taibaiella sp. KBW10]|nr:ribosome silencing factor [Taibaiella sp. KBW10]
MRKAQQRVTRDSEIFKTIISAIQDKKGERIISLDLSKIDEAVADFFIVCDAQSHIQVKAIASHIEEEVRNVLGEKPYHAEPGQQWTLVDYVNVVVHVFQTEERKFYDIESLWLDADKQEHQ